MEPSTRSVFIIRLPLSRIDSYGVKGLPRYDDEYYHHVNDMKAEKTILL
jgi:hypothetical protein